MLEFVTTYILVPTAHAQTASIGELMARVNRFVINPLITLMFIVAFVLFVWGLFQFFGSQKGSEKAGFKGGIPQGKRHIMWGIIGMAIMISVFGLMQFLINSLGVKGVDPNSSSIGNLSTKK